MPSIIEGCAHALNLPKELASWWIKNIYIYWYALLKLYCQLIKIYAILQWQVLILLFNIPKFVKNNRIVYSVLHYSDINHKTPSAAMPFTQTRYPILKFMKKNIIYFYCSACLLETNLARESFAIILPLYQNVTPQH